MGLRTNALSWLVALPLALPAAALPVPKDLGADTSPGNLGLHWSPVENAGLYRVAVFDAPEKDGKRPLLAAVWVKGNLYAYGKTVTVAKAGKFPSTKPLPLPAARKLRVMVAAAEADGSNKGEWAGLDVESAAAAPNAVVTTATATATLSPTSTPQPLTPSASVKEAQLDVQGSEEFKQTPDAAVLEIDEGGAGTAAGTGTVALPPRSASGVSGTVNAASTLGEAKGLLASGHFDQAETAYRSLLEKEPENADLWEGVGDSFAGRKMKLEAKEAYEKALALNKTKTHLVDWIEKNVRR